MTERDERLAGDTGDPTDQLADEQLEHLTGPGRPRGATRMTDRDWRRFAAWIDAANERESNP